ncbi:MAG: GNAT family N-acetyltransferase, partial [Hyphomicrobium sp.]
LLPLVVAREGRPRVARFADIGVTDYRAPILGAAAPQDRNGQRALWREITRALSGKADLVRFEAMPAEIGGRANPLAALPAATAARLTGMWTNVETTVEDFLRGRGKKYRKEAERCFRLLEKEGTPHFQRADTAEAIERAYAALQAQQSQRHGDTGNEHYVLDQPKYSEFYRDLLLAERDSGFAHIFTLEADGGIVAALMGVEQGGTFTALRISNGGPLWRHLSPGRLVVIEAMRHMVERGVRTFDLGAGDYPFKRGFGAAEIPLHDLVSALTTRGLPAVAAERSKAWLKRHPALADAAKRLAGRG